MKEGKIKSKVFRTMILVFILLLTGCSAPQLPNIVVVTQNAPAEVQAVQTVTPPAVVSGVTASPLPSATPLPTNTSQPIHTPTATIPPEPVYDPSKVMDVASLDSYQLVSKTRSKSTKADNTIEPHFLDLSVEYQKDPKIYRSTSVTGKELKSNGDLVPERTDDYYWIGNFYYDYSVEAKGWNVRVISAKSNQQYMEYVGMNYGFSSRISNLKSAQFTGKEDLHGIPVLHFTFDETDFTPNPQFDNMVKNSHVEGNIYIAQDGNYPVRYDYKGTADINTESPEAQKMWGDIVRSESEELTELVSVNQSKGINLPADAPKTDKEVDTPLPPEAELASVQSYGSLSYVYTTPKTVQETVDYYQNLTYPAGWQFEAVMSDNPDFASVILLKDKDTRILSVHFNKYNGWTEISINFFGS